MSDASNQPPSSSESPTASLWTPLLILLCGASVIVLRHVDCAAARWLAEFVSFDMLPSENQLHVDDLLLVPAASVVVVFCRVTLGLRMLGPFRPILIALAFYQTGVWAGTAFMAGVFALVVVLRPRLKRSGLLPYFGRLTVLLSVVVLLELLALLVGYHLRSDYLQQAAVFPIIVLCLSADGFARVLSDNGMVPALGRGSVTIVIAAVISALGSVTAITEFLFRHPEFVLIEVAIILVISTHMKWSLLSRSAASEG